jgi:hypothetical protein
LPISTAQRYRGIGRVMFPGYTPEDSALPHPNMPVEIWAKIPIFPDSLIASTRTDADGRFEVEFPEVRAGLLRDLDVIVKIRQVIRTEDEEGKPCEETEVVAAKVVDVIESVRTQDFGTIELLYEPCARGEAMSIGLPHQGKGQVVFETSEGEMLPHPGMHVEIWADTTLWPDELLGTAETDVEGHFDLRFKEPSHGLFRDLDVIVKLFNMARRITSDGEIIEESTDMLAFERDLDDDARQHDLGRIVVPFPPQNEDGPPIQRDGINRAQGQLVIDDGVPGASGLPLHHLRLEMWVHLTHFPSRFLGAGETDRDGRFDFRFGEPRMGLLSDLDVTLQIYDLDRTYDAAGEMVEAPREIFRTTFDPDDYDVDGRGAGTDHDLGVIEIPFWPYRHDYSVPRAGHLDDDELQSFSEGRAARHYGAVSRRAVTIGIHMGEFMLDPRHPTLAEVQADYPDNLTQRMEHQQPGITRSDAWLGDRVLNGFNPARLMREVADPGRLHVVYRWGEFPPEESQHDLSDVDAVFELVDGKLLPVEMTLSVRIATGKHQWAGEPTRHHVRRDEGERWEQAKRVFRCTYLLQGEIDTHWISTHLRVEQYAIAAHRQLRRNPLRDLLFPHLAEVTLTNRELERPAWGKTLNDESAFNARTLEERAVAVSGSADWSAWRPRQPLSPDDRYARAANIFWDVLTTHVDHFFEIEAAEIAKYWSEIARMSKDLVTHSTAYVPIETPPGLEWLDLGEIDDPEPPRAEIDGVRKAIRPVTLALEPTSEDLANARQLCRYILFHATFQHCWVHDRALDDGGEIAYACLALRGGSMGPFEDVAPNPMDATQTLFDLLLRDDVHYGRLLHDENHDIPPTLKARLLERADDFRALGVDPMSLRSRINR